MLFFCLFIYKMNKFIAFHYLKVFYDSRIKRFCLISEMLFHQQGKLLHGFGSIDLRPDKSSHIIKMNLGKPWLAKNLLRFATSIILGWALYGTRCAEFLFGSKIIRPYQVLFCLVVIAGSVANLKLVWDISDTLNGLMAIPNLIGILLLSPVVIKLTKEHFNGVKAGKLE